ncbi:hypothetical protein VTO42DRAFT_1448 [Malbranchea cinnamomea]
MPAGRPKVDLERYREEIVGLYGEGLSRIELVKYLKTIHGVEISLKTLSRRLREWRVRREPQTEYSEALFSRIQVLFFDPGLEDAKLLQVLQQEGFRVTKWGLVQARFRLGLRRRLRLRPERGQGITLTPAPHAFRQPAGFAGSLQVGVSYRDS